MPLQRRTDLTLAPTAMPSLYHDASHSRESSSSSSLASPVTPTFPSVSPSLLLFADADSLGIVSKPMLRKPTKDPREVLSTLVEPMCICMCADICLPEILC